MLDRQDIDALLVGALYGELSSSDEAILTAHLESHPADRTALDDLKSVRTKFQTSRIFELQLEPPQAVSALLLQEAARRAPKIEQRKERESWFKRFVTTFVAHPAMAAAATLVLVVGVAGTLYLKGDRPVAEQTVAQSDVTRLPAPAAAIPSMETANGVAAGSAAAAGDIGGNEKGEGVAVKLADEEQEGQGQDRAKGVKEDTKEANKKAAETPATSPAATPAHHAGPSGDVAFGNFDSRQREIKPQSTTPTAKPKPDVANSRKQYVEVGRAEHAPKDLERSGADDNTTATGGSTLAMDGDAPRQAPGNGAPATVAKAKEAPPPPPPAPVVAAAAPTADPPPQPAKKSPPQKPNTELAWAQSEHAHVVALVKDGKCQEAAPFAIAIKNRAPDYYATNVATDRALKPCMPYITDTSERSEKAAAKRATDSK